jgi:hypothetical protein
MPDSTFPKVVVMLLVEGFSVFEKSMMYLDGV